MLEPIPTPKSFSPDTNIGGQAYVNFQDLESQVDPNTTAATAESLCDIGKVGSGDVAENTSSVEVIEEPLVRAGVPSQEGVGEIEGGLELGSHPVIYGGYADIYAGTWTSLEGTRREVAVKTLRPVRPTSMTSRPDPIALQERREKRMRRELVVWTRVIHPNIHALLGFRMKPEPCLISAWCGHGNLMIYLDKNPNISRSEKLRLVQQTTRGLAYLHSQGPPICHGDIKPENVLVNDLLEAVLTDFGLSRVIQELDSSTGLTTGAGPKGSHNYMAPELFEDEDSKPTLESDVYAFGGLILAVMTGSPPFAQVDTPAKVMFRILQGKHPKPEEHPQLPPNDSIWSLIRHCWNRDRQKRPILSEIESMLEEENKKTNAAAVSPRKATEGPITSHWIMLLHNLQQQGKVHYSESVFPEGPVHCETWTSMIALLDRSNGNALGTYIGRANRRQAARESASGQALAALGYAPPS